MGRVTVVKKSDPGPGPGTVRVYIGRPGVLGNDWTHLSYGLGRYRVATREDAIEEWARWVQTQRVDSPVGRELARLRALAVDHDVELECWCAPLACHGDVIKRYIEPVLSRDDELENPDGNLKVDGQ